MASGDRTTPATPGPPEVALLAAHGIALWHDRVIFEARPPIAEAELAWIAERCAGPLPPELLALWRHTAGGALDYDLSLSMNGQRVSAGWSELFFTGSNGYRDLRGWIEHEFELTRDVAAGRGGTPASRLDYLPIGGFEYSDRIYVVVKPGPEYGHVLAWVQGVPPAWRHQLHEDAIAEVAPSLGQAFAALMLERDPVDRPPGYYTGEALNEYLDERVSAHGLPRALADAVLARYVAARCDWRTPLATGRLHEDPALAAVALRTAVDADDAPLIHQLARAQLRLDHAIAGSATPLECAVLQGQHRAAEALLDNGALVPSGILADLGSGAPVPLVQRLIQRGATPLPTAAITCVEWGAPDSAQLILRACQALDAGSLGEFNRLRRLRIAELAEALGKVRAKTLGHYLGIDGLEAHIRALETFRADRAATLLGIPLPRRSR